MQSENINELAKALAAAQAEFPVIPKDRTVKTEKFSYKYADLATIIEKVSPVLNKHGLAVTQTMQVSGDNQMLETMLMHSSGQYKSGSVLLPKGLSPQQFGSALTYYRRYSLCAMIDVTADEDDDGAAAESKDKSPQKPEGKKPQGPAHDKNETRPAALTVTIPKTSNHGGEYEYGKTSADVPFLKCKCGAPMKKANNGNGWRCQDVRQGADRNKHDWVADDMYEQALRAQHNRLMKLGAS